MDVAHRFGCEVGAQDARRLQPFQRPGEVGRPAKMADEGRSISREGAGTTVTWAMYGKANFISKAMGLFMDCEKMCGDMFTKGLTDLKTLVETTPQS